MCDESSGTLCLVDKGPTADTGFRLRIDACFTILGRGTVVAGELLYGDIPTGEVTVVHDGRPRKVMCTGVELIRVDRSSPDAPPYHPIGLLVPELAKFDPAEGDYATNIDGP